MIGENIIKPIDREAIIECSKNTGGILTLEEHSLIGGLGSAVSEVLMQELTYPKKFKMLGLKSDFTTIVGSQTYLRKQCGIDLDSIISSIYNLLN